ncbi:unnamed protein product [Peronospora belbahrii]|uniref:Uncharacterized protein n=1 Tax=Peronospora belbahrii TaxID=622444 RepID=A0ABN8D0I2_9STRA|nr:unnamed protein product [Peronospora belbahrii]
MRKHTGLPGGRGHAYQKAVGMLYRRKEQNDQDFWQFTEWMVGLREYSAGRNTFSDEMKPTRRLGTG